MPLPPGFRAPQLKAAIEAMYTAGKIVAAVCHGPIAFTHCNKADGQYTAPLPEPPCQIKIKIQPPAPLKKNPRACLIATIL